MGAEDVRDGEEGDGEEWRDPSVAAWEEAAAAVSSEPGARPKAQHAEPWTTSLAPSLRDAIDALDWSQTHAALIPNAWNRVRLATFAETWAVLGVWPPADAEEKARGSNEKTRGKRRVVLEAYGDGGIHRALARLRPDDVQYLAMRVTTDGGEPQFIAAAWLGPTSPAFIPTTTTTTTTIRRRAATVVTRLTIRRVSRRMRTPARGGEGSGRRCGTTSPARTRTSLWTAASSRRATRAPPAG